MMQAPDSPLTGFSVLLTRPAGRSAALASRLRLLGARVLEGPTIAFAEACRILVENNRTIANRSFKTNYHLIFKIFSGVFIK